MVPFQAQLTWTVASFADATVQLGTSTGALAFEPATTTIKAGETVTFVNQAG